MALGESWPRASQCARRPKAHNGRLSRWRKLITDCSIRCTQTWKANYFPNEEPTTSRLLGAIKGPPGRHGVVLVQHTRTSQEHTTNSKTPITIWFMWEIFEYVLSWDTVGFHSCALFLACVCGLVAFVLLCMLLLPLLLLFLIVIILCKVWETPTCRDSSQMKTYYKEATMVLKFDL